MNQALSLLTSVQYRQLQELSEHAGRAIMQVYEKASVAVETKKDDSPLTEADRNAHQILFEGLPAIADYPVLSEEGINIAWDVRKQWQTYWLIDPLDGTKEFLKRNGEFTVNIALVHEGHPILGVVHAPALGVTYYGARGNGAFKIERTTAPIPIHTATPPQSGSRPWRIVGSRSHQSEEFQQFLAGYPGADVVSVGSSLKLCLVAEGKADLYPRLGPTSEWDTAAAHAVAEAAGAEVIAIETGHPLAYNQKESLLNPYFLVRARAGASN